MPDLCQRLEFSLIDCLFYLLVCLFVFFVGLFVCSIFLLFVDKSEDDDQNNFDPASGEKDS